MRLQVLFVFLLGVPIAFLLDARLEVRLEMPLGLSLGIRFGIGLGILSGIGFAMPIKEPLTS